MDHFKGGEGPWGLEATAEIVGRDKVSEMRSQLIMVFVAEALDGRYLDCAVRSLELTIRSGMFHLGQPMFDAVFVADPTRIVSPSVV